MWRIWCAFLYRISCEMLLICTSPSQWHVTPLHNAAKRGSLEIVILLSERGAVLDVKSKVCSYFVGFLHQTLLGEFFRTKIHPFMKLLPKAPFQSSNVCASMAQHSMWKLMSVLNGEILLLCSRLTYSISAGSHSAVHGSARRPSRYRWAIAGKTCLRGSFGDTLICCNLRWITLKLFPILVSFVAWQ